MTLTKRYFIAGFAAVAPAIFSAPAHATLIGDLVSVEYHFPSLGSIFEEHLTTVQAGSTDSVTLLAGTLTPATVNVEESSVRIDFAPVTFNPVATFNGIFIRDLDFSGAPGPIVGLQIATNASGWNDSFASFTSDSIALNYVSLGTLQDGFSMTVDLVVQQETPEPGTLALMVLGLSALGAAARRSRRAF